MVREYRIPVGVEYYIGTPAIATPDRLWEAVKNALATVPGVAEAHMPLLFIVGVSSQAELVLLVVPDNSTETESIRASIMFALDNSLDASDEMGLLVLDGTDPMIVQARATNRRII